MRVDSALLIDYALGTLPRERVQEVETFLRTQPASARRVRRTQDDVARLVMSLPPELEDEAAEEAFAEGLRQRLRNHPRPPLPQRRVKSSAARRGPRWAALGLATAMGVAAWLILGPFLNSNGLERTLERYQAQPGSVSTPLISSTGRELGTLVHLEDDRLFVAFDQQPDGEVYQLWEMGGAEPRSLGVVDGRSLLTEPVASGSTVGLTIEPAVGSLEPTSAPLVVLTL